MKTYTVSLTFEGVEAMNPLDVAQEIALWLREDSFTMIYDVTDENSGSSYTVDLAESDEDAVLPNN